MQRCLGIAKSTGQQCKNLVSSSGSGYCSYHKKQTPVRETKEEVKVSKEEEEKVSKEEAKRNKEEMKVPKRVTALSSTVLFDTLKHGHAENLQLCLAQHFQRLVGADFQHSSMNEGTVKNVILALYQDDDSVRWISEMDVGKTRSPTSKGGYADLSLVSDEKDAILFELKNLRLPTWKECKKNDRWSLERVLKSFDMLPADAEPQFTTFEGQTTTPKDTLQAAQEQVDNYTSAKYHVVGRVCVVVYGNRVRVNCFTS
jgi:hypothetical protein